jgi:hypothetical protein
MTNSGQGDTMAFGNMLPPEEDDTGDIDQTFDGGFSIPPPIGDNSMQAPFDMWIQIDFDGDGEIDYGIPIEFDSPDSQVNQAASASGFVL